MGIRRAAARLAGTLLVAAQVAACTQIVSTAGSGAPPTPPTSATPGTLPSGSPSEPAPSVVPSPSTIPTPTAGPGAIDVLLPGSGVAVAVAELNLREGPSTSAARVKVLKRGAVLIVSPYDGLWFGAGPVRKNGYTWYPVLVAQVTNADGGLPALPKRPILYGTEVDVGWIATDDGQRSYVRALPPRCPTTVNLAVVEAMLSAERLACFGGPIVLEGTFGCPSCGAELAGEFEPIWLNYPQALEFLSLDPPAQVGPIVLRFPPGGPEPPTGGSIIRVTVHVDDPAAGGCSITIAGEAPVPALTAGLFCREQLVVDSYEIIGTDPDFPG